MKNLIDIEEFDQFLNNEMGPLEKEIFQDKIQSSNRVNDAFLLHKIIVDTVRETPKREAIKKLNKNTKNIFKERRKQEFNAYLKNLFSIKERKEFEKKLLEDKLFEFEFRQYKSSLTSTRRNTYMYIKRISQIAAIFILGFILYSLFTTSPSNNLSYSELYVENFKLPSIEYVDDVSIKPKSGKNGPEEIAEDINKFKTDGLNAFNNRQPHTAIQKLTQYTSLTENNDDNGFLYLYIGLSYKELGEYENCIKALTYGMSNIKEPSNILRKELVQWHLALTYLKINDIPNTKTILNQLILSGDEDMKNQAINLLNKLS